MHNPTTILSKILEIFPRNEFEKLVKERNADKYSKVYTTWNQFVVMLTAQAKGWHSLRELETGFKIHNSKLYHLGFGTAPKKSTIARVNKNRPHEIYEEYFYKIKDKLQPKLNKNKFDFKLNEVLKIIDSSTVKLSIRLFDWAKFRYNKGALKIHTSFNLTDQIPEFINMTDGKTGDINGINFNSYHDCILVYDRAYIDVGWFNVLDKNKVKVVSRVKSNMKFEVVGQHQKADLNKGIVKDELVQFESKKSKEKYPKTFRRVTCLDKETGEIYQYFTNDFSYDAEVIVYIYRKRWEIELFFKWIKQNLKIKTFFGTSENAVKTQIWIAMIYYLILRYMQGQTEIKSILELTRILKEILLDNRDIFDLYSEEFRSSAILVDEDVGQLTLI